VINLLRAEENPAIFPFLRQLGDDEKGGRLPGTGDIGMKPAPGGVT
jgi:hypothetical protein